MQSPRDTLHSSCHVASAIRGAANHLTLSPTSQRVEDLLDALVLRRSGVVPHGRPSENIQAVEIEQAHVRGSEASRSI